MSKTKSEEPEPIVLSVSLIESGRFIRAGEPTPYLRVEDVPAHLKECTSPPRRIRRRGVQERETFITTRSRSQN